MAYLGAFVNRSCSVHKSAREYPQIFRNTKKKEEGRENKDALDDPGRIQSQAKKKKNYLIQNVQTGSEAHPYANNWVPVFIPGVRRMGHTV